MSKYSLNKVQATTEPPFEQASKEQLVKQKEKPGRYKKALNSVKKNWQLYAIITPVIAYFVVFHYFPLYGLQIAFKDFIPSLGVWDSPWVGFKHFERFFESYYFERLIVNTIMIGVLTLLFAFPIPIILALMLNEVQSLRYKKFVQTVLCTALSINGRCCRDVAAIYSTRWCCQSAHYAVWWHAD